MAQTKERTQPEAKSPPKATQQTTDTAPKRNWLSLLRPPVTNAPSQDGKPGRRAGGTIFKSFFGILIWFVASQFIMYLLLIVDGWLTKPGQRPPLETTHLFPPNTPLLGWITPFMLLYGGAVIGLWFLLIRFNLIPRDFFGARAQAQERARRQAAGTTPTGASTGPRKTRTQRRYAELQAQTNAKGRKNGATSSAKTPAKKASDARKPVAVATGTHDSEYERVRSADRLRRRRESKR